MSPAAQPAVKLALTLVGAALAGALALALHSPLPWLIGPLLATAAASALGAPLAASHRLRNAGQWIIGTALGLYFTPAVLVRYGAVLVLTGPLWRREKARLARRAVA